MPLDTLPCEPETKKRGIFSIFSRTKASVPSIEPVDPERLIAMRSMLQRSREERDKINNELETMLSKFISPELRPRFDEAVKLGDSGYEDRSHPIFQTKAFSFSMQWARGSSGEDKEKRARLLDKKNHEMGDSNTSIMLIVLMLHARDLPWKDHTGFGNYGRQILDFYLRNRDLFPDLLPDDVLTIYRSNDRAFASSIERAINEHCEYEKRLLSQQI